MLEKKAFSQSSGLRLWVAVDGVNTRKGTGDHYRKGMGENEKDLKNFMSWTSPKNSAMQAPVPQRGGCQNLQNTVDQGGGGSNFPKHGYCGWVP